MTVTGNHSSYKISKPSLLAVLLYAKGAKGKPSEEIIGKTRLMKLMFLILKEGVIEEQLKGKFSFEPYKYGPFDSEIYDSIEALESMNIIENITDVSFNSKEFEDEEYDTKITFKLTDKGIEKTKRIVDKMPIKLYKKIETIKIIYSRKPLIQLLHYVYSKYPEYSTKSELDLF